MAEAHAQHVRVLAALGQGDFDDAYSHATQISPPGVLAPYIPLALWVAMDRAGPSRLTRPWGTSMRLVGSACRAVPVVCLLAAGDDTLARA